MAVMTGGEAVVAALHALDVRHVFAIVSVHNLPILDAIARDGKISLVAARHEQGAVHAADGYARATGRLGVAITSTGPGAANAVGGLFEAHFSSSPVLMITGQVETPWVGRGRGALHEADNQIEMLRSVTRRAESVRHHGEIAATVVRCGARRAHRPSPPGGGGDPDRLAVQPGRGRGPAVSRQQRAAGRGRVGASRGDCSSARSGRCCGPVAASSLPTAAAALHRAGRAPRRTGAHLRARPRRDPRGSPPRPRRQLRPGDDRPDDRRRRRRARGRHPLPDDRQHRTGADDPRADWSTSTSTRP